MKKFLNGKKSLEKFAKYRGAPEKTIYANRNHAVFMGEHIISKVRKVRRSPRKNPRKIEISLYLRRTQNLKNFEKYGGAPEKTIT